MPSVGTTPVHIGSGVLVQNLGPDDLYIGESTVTEANGVLLAAGVSVAVGYGLSYYVVSSDTSDVRLLGGAVGVFTGVAPA